MTPKLSFTIKAHQRKKESSVDGCPLASKHYFLIFSSLCLVALTFPSHAADPACGSSSHGWLPWTWAVYAGDNFIQKNNCGSTRTRTGTKNHSYWIGDNYQPKSNTICKNTAFTQTLQYPNGYSHNRPNWGTSLGNNWQPKRNSQCVGTSFTQTSSCNATRTKTGTKPVGGFTPATDTQACGVSFTQTRVCGSSQSAIGTADSADWTPAVSTVCQGESFTQTRSCGTPRTEVGTKIDGACAPPATPSGLLASNVMPHDANIQWGPELHTSEYRVEQWDATNTTWSLAYNGPDTSYLASNLSPDDYQFKVTACSSLGCSGATNPVLLTVTQQNDTDGDGVYDYEDTCPGTPPGASVDGGGCDEFQVDSDSDGVPDYQDPYPHQGGMQCLA